MAEEDDNTLTDVPETEEGAEPEGEPGIEDRARQHGWVPKEEFRGSEDRWVDAETFMQRADNELPIARERMKKLESRNAELDRTVREFIREQRAKDKQQHERSVAQIKRERDKALDEADTDTVKRLDQELEQAQQAAPPEPPKEPDKGWTPDFESAVESFKATNSEWYGKDPLRTKEFAEYHDFLLGTNPEMGHEERLEAAKQAVFEKYPKAPPARNRSGSPVEAGAGNSGKRGSKKRGYADLPPEAKQAYDKFVNKDQIMSGEEYLREYFAEENEG